MATLQLSKRSLSFPCSSASLEHQPDAATGYQSPLKRCCALWSPPKQRCAPSMRKADQRGEQRQPGSREGQPLWTCLPEQQVHPAATTTIAVRLEPSETVAGYGTGQPGSLFDGPCTSPPPAPDSTGPFLPHGCPSPLHRFLIPTSLVF